MSGRGTGAATGHALAVDFGGSKVTIAAVTPDGDPFARRRLDIAPGTHARQVLDATLRELAALRRDPALREAGCCRGIGVASPGIIGPDRIELAPNVPGWGDLALADELRGATGVARVVVANDVKAATWAEHRWGALAGCDPGVYVNLGTGIAAGILVGGQVLGGCHGAAGEIGYLPVHLPGAPGGGDGPVLEDLVGGGAVGRRARALPSPVGSARELFALVAYDPGGREPAADPGAPDAAADPDAAALVRQVVRTIGGAVVALATMLDPQRIALGGGLSAAAAVLPGVTEVVRRLAPMPVDVVPARFVHEAALRGAAALVTQPG